MQIFDAAIAPADVDERVVLRELVVEADPALLLVLLDAVFLAQCTTNAGVGRGLLLGLQVFADGLDPVVQ